MDGGWITHLRLYSGKWGKMKHRSPWFRSHAMPGQLIYMNDEQSGMSPGRLWAEEWNEFSVRWAVLSRLRGQMIRHQIQGACFVAQLGPLQSCNQGIGQGWSPIRVEGFTSKLMWSLEEFRGHRLRERGLQFLAGGPENKRLPSVPHYLALTARWGSSQHGSLLLKSPQGKRVLARQVLQSYGT